MQPSEKDVGSGRWVELLTSLVRAAVTPPPSAPVQKSGTEKLAAYSAAATAFLTVGIIVLGVSQYFVNKGQLAVMQRQLDDAELKDSASVLIRNLAIAGFPDHTIASFDLYNIGPTRAEMVTIIPTFKWGPQGPQTMSNLVDPREMLFYQPNEFGFTLASEEHRHVDMPVPGVESFEIP
jgi:hypothetical protein